jgi:hypothetical protein
MKLLPAAPVIEQQSVITVFDSSSGSSHQQKDSAAVIQYHISVLLQYAVIELSHINHCT